MRSSGPRMGNAPCSICGFQNAHTFTCPREPKLEPSRAIAHHCGRCHRSPCACPCNCVREQGYLELCAKHRLDAIASLWGARDMTPEESKIYADKRKAMFHTGSSDHALKLAERALVTAGCTRPCTDAHPCQRCHALAAISALDGKR